LSISNSICELTAVRAGRRVRIRRSDLDAYLVEISRREPGPEPEPDERDMAWGAFANAMSAVAATADRRDVAELKRALEGLSEAARVLADALVG